MSDLSKLAERLEAEIVAAEQDNDRYEPYVPHLDVLREAAAALRAPTGSPATDAVTENRCADKLLTELNCLGVNTENWDGDEGLWPTLARGIVRHVNVREPVVGEPELITELRAGSPLHYNPNLKDEWGEQMLAAWDALSALPPETAVPQAEVPAVTEDMKRAGYLAPIPGGSRACDWLAKHRPGKSYSNMLDMFERAHLAMRPLDPYVQALERDKERLDWLERNHHFNGTSDIVDEVQFYRWEFSTINNGKQWEPLRDKLDAAIDAAQGGS